MIYFCFFLESELEEFCKYKILILGVCMKFKFIEICDDKDF